MDVTWHNLFSTVEGLVAVGTISLAFVTGVLAAATLRLASLTKGEVKTLTREVASSEKTAKAIEKQAASAQDQVLNSQQQLEVARSSLAATFRPVLIQEEGGPLIDSTAGRVEFRFDIRNEGAGIAFVTGAVLRSSTGDHAGGSPSNAIIPKGQVSQLRFQLPLSDYDAVRQYGNVSIVVDYADLGANRWTSRFDIKFGTEGGPWYLYQVFVKPSDAPDTEAVGSGPMAVS